MKLHLPQILLTALLVAMSALPTYAATTFKVGDGLAKEWDGVLRGDTKYWTERQHKVGDELQTVPRYFDTLDGDVEITVDGEDSECTMSLEHDTTKGGELAGETEPGFLQRGDITIKVTNGGTLKMASNAEDRKHFNNGYTRFYFGTIIEDSGVPLYKTSATELNANLIVDGGTVDIRDTNFTFGYSAWDQENEQTQNFKTNVNMDVQHGSLSITEEITESGEPRKATLVGSQMRPGGTVSTKIRVGEKGEMKLTSSSTNFLQIGWLSSHFELTVEDGGQLITDGAAIGEYSHSRISGTWGSMTDEVNASVIVRGKGSQITMRGGQMVDFSIDEPEGGECGKGKVLIDGGTLAIERSEKAYYWQPKIGCAGAGAGEFELTLTNNATLTVSEDAYAVFGSSDADGLGVKTVVNVESGSTLTMYSGKIAKGTASTLEINLRGGTFTASGTGDYASKIAADASGNAASSVLNIYDGTFTIKEEARFTGSINVYGGNLAFDEGCYVHGVNDAVRIQIKGTEGKAVSLGTVGAGLIEKVEILTGGVTLTNIGSGTLTLRDGDILTFAGKSVSTSEEGGETTAVLQFVDSAAEKNVTVEDGGRVLLDFTGARLTSQAGANGKVNRRVHLTNGELSGWTDASDKAAWLQEHFRVGTGWGVHVTDWDAETGTLVLAGSTETVWEATQHDEAQTGQAKAMLSDLAGYSKVVVDEDSVFTVDDDGFIEQLSGAEEGDLTMKNGGEGGEEHDVTLHNQDVEGSPGATEFKGNITVEPGINLKKTGDAGLTVGGNLKTGGDLAVTEGSLTLNGEENSVDGTLSLGDEDSAGELRVGGNLTLNGDNDLSASKGSLTGDGTITSEGDLKLGDGVEVDEQLKFGIGEKGSVDFGSGDRRIGGLSGSGSVSTEGSLSVGGSGTYEGKLSGDVRMEGEYTLSGKENGNCDLSVGSSGHVTLAPGSSYRSLKNGTSAEGNKSRLTLAADETGTSAGTGITVSEDIVFFDGSTTDFVLNLNSDKLWKGHDATMLDTQKKVYIEKHAKIVIDCYESGLTAAQGDLRDVVILHGSEVINDEYPGATVEEVTPTALALEEEKGEVVEADVELGGILGVLYENVRLRYDENTTYLDADRRTRSVITPSVSSRNASAGLGLLWNNLNDMQTADPAAWALLEYLTQLVQTDPAAVNHTLAAISGSTLTSLSSAQNAEHRWQMGRVRDHALMAGNLRCAEYNPDATRVGACRTTQVWAEGTSFYSEQHTRGDESGYRLNSWGGALGMDVQMRSNWSVGLALAANYGDLEANAADHAKGDFDSYYMSAWSQAKNGRWGNTLVATFGISEASLNRTVNAAGASYTAKSSPSGSSLGAMWELTYDLYPVKDNHRQVLQPLFSVAVSHTSMDAFSETGAGGLGLSADKQTRDTVTLGLGARWMAAIETGKAANRTIGTELRMNVAQDMGDRRSTADVALLADPSYTQTVRGARAGTTAFQFGAGVNIPVTRYSQLYLNAGGDLRTHAATWNGALGVRIGF